MAGSKSCTNVAFDLFEYPTECQVRRIS